MQSEKFEALLAGHPCTLTQGQLLELQAYCSARSLSLQQWITASVGLFASNPEQSYQILCYLDRNELSKTAYNDYVHQGPKIAIYNALTGLVLAKSTREPAKEQAEKMLNEAKRFLNSSQKVRMNVDKSIILNRALLHYYSGQITKALNFLTRTHDEILKTGEGRHLLVTTTLVLAQIHFIKRNYAKSLQLYKKALEINKNLPTKARLGMAYSFYYLGKYEMARACFQRIVKLDPNSVEAHLGIAIIEEKVENYEQYFNELRIALSINQDHPLVLLHLAEHFLLKDDLQKAFSICLSGLSALERFPKFIRLQESCRNDYEELKARFNNIIGQIHHINGNFGDAIKYYTLASGKGLVHNQIALAQAYINPSAQNYLQAMKLLEEAYKQFEGKDSRLISDSYKLMGYLKSKIPPKGKQEKNAQYYYSEALKFNRKDFDTKIQYSNILAEVNKAKALRQLLQAQAIQRSHLNMVKPQLENNIAVLQLENGQPELCQQRLKKCLTVLDNMSTQNEQEELRRNSLRIIVRFNYGISLQKQMRWHSARQIYLQIFNMNKYHQDSHIRLAYTEFQLGNYQKVKQIFQQAQKLCSENKFKLLRPERIYVAKAYLQHLGGSSHAAKQTLKQLGKVKDLFAQLFQLCINYENIMRKGVELNNLKEFLRPNRQFCYKYCSEDPHTMFGYMLLAIILIADKKFTKSQGMEFFSSLKQFCSQDMPVILYNMGLFLSNYDDHESSNSVLGLYKERIGVSNRADQLISANYLFQNEFPHSESYVKRNILRDPSNIKYRMQLSYVAERRCLKYYERGVYDRKSVRLYNEQLNRCNNFQTFFSKMVVGDYIRGIEVPELKQRLRTIYVKIKNAGQERKFYITSYMESYQKLAKDLDLKEIEKKEIEKRNQERIQNQLKEKQLEKLLQEDSEDEQEREKRIREEKRKRALQLARKRQIQMEINWNELKQKHKELEQEKKSRKRTPSTKPSGPRPRRERPKQDSQSPALSLPQQSEPEVRSQAESEEESQKEHKKKKKNKHKHKNKKRNKDRANSGEDQDGSPQQRSEGEESSSKKKENKKDDDDDEDLLLRNYMA